MIGNQLITKLRLEDGPLLNDFVQLEPTMFYDRPQLVGKGITEVRQFRTTARTITERCFAGDKY